MKVVDIAVGSSPHDARDIAAHQLQFQQFRLTWHDEWSATAERGSQGMNVAFGAFAQYFKFGLRVMTAPDGNTVVRFERSTSGWWGGAIGASRNTKQFQQLCDSYASFVRQRGELLGVHEYDV